MNRVLPEAVASENFIGAEIEEIVLEEHCITTKLPGYPAIKIYLHKSRDIGVISIVDESDTLLAA